MKPSEFQEICCSGNIEAAIHVMCDEAEERWLDEGSGALSEGQMTVLAVELFFGEVLNGGFRQYFMNCSGGLANHAALSLRRIGLDDYATVLETFLARFPGGQVPEDGEQRLKQLNTFYGHMTQSEFDSHEQPFWNRYEDESEYREKLFVYLCTHEEQFVT